MTWPAVAVVLAAIAGQAVRTGRALDALGGRIDRLEDRLGRVEAGVRDTAVNLAGLSERVGVLEGRERS